MAVPLDLASPSDLTRAPALRPLVQGVAGDEKHDPIRKIYVRFSSRSKSALRSEPAALAASGLWLNCLWLCLYLCSADSNIIRSIPGELLALYFVKSPGCIFDQGPTCTYLFQPCLLLNIGLYEKSIYLFTCKRSIFSRWRVIFVLL